MRRLLFAVGFVVGCEEEAPPPPPPPVAVEKADTGEAAEETKEQEPEKPVRTPAQAAHDLMLAGQFAEASAAAAKLEDRALGARLQRVAARAGGPVPTDASAVFNAELALESGKAQAAFDALFPSLGDDLGDAAVVVARAIAAEIAPKRINVVSPGIIDTPMVALSGDDRIQHYKNVTRAHLIDRPGDPKEVAKGIIFAIENDFITGTTIDIDGGWLAVQ